MRVLSVVFVLISAVSISAQSAVVRQPFDEGMRLARSGDFQQALVSYKAAREAAAKEQTPDEFAAKLYYNLGVCEYRLERHAAAIEHLERAIASSGGVYTKAYYALGMARAAVENWADARRAFWKVLETDREDAEAWFDMGLARLGDSDLDGAEIAFRNAIDFHSVDAALGRNNVGVLLALRGENAEAMKEFESAISESGGKLEIAKRNLEYCRSHSDGLRSEFQFGRRQRAVY